MPRYIVKIKDRYFDWSTIVDAPLTYGMTLEELEEYHREMYGIQGHRDFAQRMERVEKKGCSCVYGYVTMEHVVTQNRCGDNEESLTIDEIYELYGFPPEEEA